jgi:hypothetical protein
MNSRSVIYAAVPLIAFSLTVAIGLWQRRSEAPSTAANPALSAVASANAAAPRTESRSAETPPADPPPPAAPEHAAASGPVAAEVPVRLLVRNRPGESALMAVMLNTTEDDLDVRVSAVNPKTYLRSVVDVSLGPHARKNLIAAGLDVSPGATLTVESPPFRALVVQAN